MQRWAFILAVGLLGGASAPAQQQQREAKQTHAILVRAESEPPGATLFSLDPETGRPISQIAATPCTLVVGLAWKDGTVPTRSDQLSVWTEGNVGSARFNADGSCDVLLRVAAKARGLKDKRFDIRLATLDPRGFTSSIRSRIWPGEVKVTFEMRDMPDHSILTPLKASSVGTLMPEGDDLRWPDPKPAAVVLRGGGEPNAGAVTFFCNIADADILVDGYSVGVTPVQVLLSPGRHRIQVSKQSYQSLDESIEVTPGPVQQAFKAILVR